MKNVLRAIAIASVMAPALHAQASMTGRWQGETPGGSQVVLEVKAAETVLTGALTVDGQRQTLAEGKVSKNTFTFKVMLPPNDAVQAFTGEFAQDQMKIWMDERGPSNAAVLKRVK
jgi:hypothetical protein